MFQLLQESAVPVTDKIFPWFVETALLRVEMEGLQDTLRSAQSMPISVADGVARVLVEPIRSIDLTRLEVTKLLGQLQRSAVMEADMSRSGRRGLVAAMRAITRHKNLAVVVGVFSLCSALFGGWLVWQVESKNREILGYNKAVMERCYQRFLPRKGTTKWFSCPGFQLPRIR